MLIALAVGVPAPAVFINVCAVSNFIIPDISKKENLFNFPTWNEAHMSRSFYADIADQSD